MTLPPLPLPSLPALPGALPPLPKLHASKMPRVMAAEDFKSYREQPFFMRAVRLTPPRNKFPHAAAHLDEVLRRMHQLMTPPPLPR